MKKRGHSESGQTLIVIMFVLLVMIIGGIFLFDLQTMIRGKIKSQSAVDSAALVGAEWQKHTLNMIGELNLIKASTVLLSDYTQGVAYNDVTFLDVRMAELSNIILTERGNAAVGIPDTHTQIYKGSIEDDLVDNSHGSVVPGFAPLEFGYGNQVFYRANGDKRQWHWQIGANPLRGKELIYSMALQTHDVTSFTVDSQGVVYIAVRSDHEINGYSAHVDDGEGNILTPNSNQLGPWEYIAGADAYMRYYEDGGARVACAGCATVLSHPHYVSDRHYYVLYRRYFGATEIGNQITLTPNFSNRAPIILTLQDVTNIPEGMKDELRSVAYAADKISNMQSRVSFVGPMIGFGAAQQAAKNNGVPNNDDFTEVVTEQFLRLRYGTQYTAANGVMQTIPYRDPLNERFPYDYSHRGMGDPGYRWRSDYWTMLDPIQQDGIAVAPNVRFLGIPDLDGDTWFTRHGYATDKMIYNAVIARDWCVLRDILREDFHNAWWGEIDIGLPDFVKESEYLPVGIRFNSFQSTHFDPNVDWSKTQYVDPMLTDGDRNFISIRDEYDVSQPYSHGPNIHGEFDQYSNPDNDSDGKYDPIPYIEFAVFDGTWWPYHEEWVDAWGLYTEKQFVEGMDYWGGTVRMSTNLEVSLLSGKLTPTAEDGGAQAYLGDTLRDEFSDIDMDIGDGAERRVVSFEDVARDIRSSEKNLRRMNPKVEVSSAAKAYGRFNLNGVIEQPIIAGMVLPVFTDVALIPVALEDPGGLDPFDVDFYRWVTEGLPILGQYDNIGEAAVELRAHRHWSSFSPYFGAIQNLNDGDWRAEGTDWLETVINVGDDGDERTNGDTCEWNQRGSIPVQGGPPKVH